jgi:hypothetical protein
MQAKPVQIAVIVIGLIVGIVGIFLAVSGGSGPQLADKMILVDVTTGDTFAVSIKGRSIMLPSKNPDTQERTLFPIEQDENNEWSISPRYLSALDNIDNISSIVNPENGSIDIPEDIDPTVLK